MFSLTRYILTWSFSKGPQLFFLLLFSSPFSYSQFYNVRNFNVESGLPSSDVYNLLQDSKGYIWIATDMGVSRYNGVEFKNFSTENGLPDNTVFGFCEDVKGRIWFISFSGKLSYFSGDSIYVLPCNKALENEVRSKLMLSIYVDPADTIWIGTHSNEVLKIAPLWQANNVSWITLPNEGAYLWQVDKNHLVFGGVIRTNNLTTLYYKSLQRIHRLYMGHVDRWHTYNKFYGLRLNDGSYLSSTGYLLSKFRKDSLVSSVSLPKGGFIMFLEDKDKRIVSMAHDGVRIHEPDKLEHYITIPDFSDKICTAGLLDKEGSLWIATEGQGLYCIPFRGTHYYTTDHGMPESRISCLAEKNGAIFAGHLNGTVSILKGDTVKNISFHSPENKLSRNKRLISFYIPNATDIYVSGQMNIYKLGKDYSFKAINNQDGAYRFLPINDSLVLTSSNRNILWRDPRANFLMKKKLKSGQYIDNAFRDRQGDLWICGVNGLLRYRGNKLQPMGEENPLLANRIVDIAEDKVGRLWMSSRGAGVIVKDGSAFYTIQQSNGLASNMCRNLYIDSNQTIWVGSNKGLSKIRVKSARPFSYAINIYTKQDGLLSNEVNYITGRGHELILAHNDGISILDPGILKNNSIAPPVYITRVDISGKSYDRDSLYLDYEENYLKINYIGLSFKNPGAVEYKYKMKGLDTSWVHTGYTSAQFQALDPGEYTFLVYAKNTDGYWSSKPATLQLFILPRWWQTWLFKFLSFGFLTALFYFFVKISWDRRKRRLYENAALKHRMTTSELKALRAQMNPHFIFNAINSIQHFITSNDPIASQKFLSKFAKLIRYVVDNAKPISIPLDKEIEALRLFLDLEKLRFENRFDYQITVSNNINTDIIQIPSMLIQPYIENCIWHGIMHKAGTGKIDIRFNLQGQLLRCVVEDNGIGRKRSQELKLNQSRPAHKPAGMSLTKERLEIINQLNKSKLSIKITDLEDGQGNALGTRVELFIPVS